MSNFLRHLKLDQSRPEKSIGMITETHHRIYLRNGDALSELDDSSVSLVVTSPPYPMIEMWDKSFAVQNPGVSRALKDNEPEQAFELMHQILDKVWQECYRVLCDGGIACINIGDATRTTNKKFQLFANHARILSAFLELGFSNLPNIIWRKQTNAPNKFMGSGMLPPGAYVTLEHEFILVFRKGNKREFFSREKQQRRESAYFWEERNQWFSDLWDSKGTAQMIAENGVRNRSAAFPFDVPYRLINMFSIRGDTILDPFLGTGTSTLAAVASGRNSAGYELESAFARIIRSTLLSELNLELANKTIWKRISNHKNFVDRRIKEKGRGSIKYFNQWFNLPVVTRQEKEMRLQFVESVKETGNQRYSASYRREALLDCSGTLLLSSQD